MANKNIKQPQDFKRKASKAATNPKATQQDFLELLTSIREEKDLDQMQELFVSIFSMYGLTTDEVAALLFSTMRQVLHEQQNKDMLADKFSIDVTKLGAEGVLRVQRALLSAYLDKVNTNEA
ncbi:hypothetical protein [Carnobacterium antarcticum]|uniref:Uncharacterized protein n=1 Tax=Carnobacterium antarcticum TaxID=2126436 RepID=A0ABW4NNP0_9LACT|nr:hypothetical protein [Carnobacterium sp. CP1]ALV21049.1 hypothetical protein NY10_429 [Carnobacterium sp. CP1]